ncbi:MAG: DegV family protein [Actinobacteria bacterium]|nr:DegV family protein [Actinomycetota bacterium]
MFVVGTLDLARSGGRLDPSADATEGVPVLRLRDGQVTVVDTVASAEEAASVMATEILAAGKWLRIGIGVSDTSSVPVGNQLFGLLVAEVPDVEVISYRVGPSVGVHTGPGTAGAVYHLRG